MLYEKEGLNVKKIDYTDNQDCIGKWTIFLMVIFSHAHSHISKLGWSLSSANLS